MATVNFSVPEDIKRRFNRTFKGRNKSAVIARLMEQAIEEEARHQRHQHAMDELLKLRKRIRPITDEEFRQARSEGRP